LLLDRLIEADAHDSRRTIAGMTPPGLAKAEGLFALWAHAGQLPPSGVDWRVWLLLAGRCRTNSRSASTARI